MTTFMVLKQLLLLTSDRNDRILLLRLQLEKLWQYIKTEYEAKEKTDISVRTLMVTWFNPS